MPISEIIISFCVSIIASVLYDAPTMLSSHSTSQNNEQEKSELEDELRTYFKEQQSFESLVVREHYDIFTSFLRSPQVSDFFSLYMNYMLKGSHYTELSKELNLQPGVLSASNEKIAEYLTKNFINLYSKEFNKRPPLKRVVLGLPL